MKLNTYPVIDIIIFLTAIGLFILAVAFVGLVVGMSL